MVKSGKKSENIWGTTSYKLPIPYLRPRVLNKGQPEPGKCRFISTVADGPAYKFARDKKGVIIKNVSYGKDAKTPPVSYLPLPDWTKGIKPKAELKAEDRAKTTRGSFIDEILFYEKKYKYPGPANYFEEKKKEEKGMLKNKEAFVRPCFLNDYQYLGLNIPGPGTYKLKDTWADPGKKRVITEEDKKKGYVAESWRVKNDKKNGPGQYEITRLLSVKEDKEKKAFMPIPVFERTTLGLINKVEL